MEDTIAAISTALGVGAISIIRVSGPQAISIVNSIFHGRNLNEVASHTINYGYIEDHNEKIDEVLVSVMREPKTFTKEDVVEINCHGGIATTQKVLEILLNNGCRLAEPGEFTKRAFLNGRIDLVEAEGIMNLIEAKTDQARDMAIHQVNGRVSKTIKALRQDIIELLANIEVNIDYPEYEDIEQVTINQLSSKTAIVKEQIKKIISESENSKLIKEGIKTVIVGRPNVGKSSILNMLIAEDKAIVTEIEGTTRDIVEGNLNIDGIMLNIIDTAGIRETENIVEKIGVNKSLELIDEADLILFVLNNNQELTDEDKLIFDKIKDKNYIAIINKTDLENKLDIKDLNIEQIVYMSAINNQGMEELKQKIKELFNLEKITTADFTYLTNAYSISLLKKCLNIISDIEIGIKNNNPVDMIEIDIKSIWSILGTIIGETYEEELINQLFSQFCLGK